MRKVELLAPARDAEIGIEAINHGADAVYIGAPQFSARAAAGNDVRDIARLAAYGHRYAAKTLVALNTLLTDAELPEAERLVWQLYEAGVDALIVQDLGLLSLRLPPMPLHASTQTDNRTAAKVRLMHDLGMERVVLARELSLADVRAIHEAVPDVELECFVHGALCVGVSGQCYLSAALTGRSANRGTCAQPCRLPMTLTDAAGRTLARGRHLLSLRDMNRGAYLADLIEAGVTSLKIEGRLKDMAYVKNVTAWYRRQLDRVLEDHNADVAADGTGGNAMWRAASSGRVTYNFEPHPAKSFNRGFTDYYLKGTRATRAGVAAPIWNFDTPKSVGERVGEVGRVGREGFVVRSELELHNGDGLVAIAPGGTTVGFRLNRYDAATRTAYPAGAASVTAQLRSGMALWRNHDEAFDRALGRPTADRRVGVALSVEATPEAVRLTARDEDGNEASEVCLPEAADGAFAPAGKAQEDNRRRQLTKLGETIFALTGWRDTTAGADPFVPSSRLAELRRRTMDKLLAVRMEADARCRRAFVAPDYAARAATLRADGLLPTDGRAHAMNAAARALMARMGGTDVAPAFELRADSAMPVMETVHCLKYALGRCPRYPLAKGAVRLPEDVPAPEPWTLQIGERKFNIIFGCKNDCMSKIFAKFAPQK